MAKSSIERKAAAAAKKPAAGAGKKIVASNRKARHNYSILEVFEAGVVLVGTEVKSLREGQASMADAFATALLLTVLAALGFLGWRFMRTRANARHGGGEK